MFLELKVTEKFSQMAEKNRLRSSQQGFGSICGFGLLGLSSLSRLSEEMEAPWAWPVGAPF
jgi:hypothetical protein